MNENWRVIIPHETPRVQVLGEALTRPHTSHTLNRPPSQSQPICIRTPTHQLLPVSVPEDNCRYFALSSITEPIPSINRLTTAKTIRPSASVATARIKYQQPTQPLAYHRTYAWNGASIRPIYPPRGQQSQRLNPDYFGQSDWMAQRPKFPIARTTSPLRLNIEKQGAQSNVFKDITPLQLENMSEQLKCGRIKAGISERRNRRKNGRQRYSQEHGAALISEFAATPIRQKPTEVTAIDSIMTQSIISRF